jgi:superfamily II DNA helicase RecQ
MRDKKWFNLQKREAARTRQPQATESNLDSEKGSTMLVDPIVTFMELLEVAADLPAVQSLLPTACKMDIATQMQYIRTALKHLYSFEPRPKQVEAIHALIFLQVDLILIAKTSFGKSMVLQAPSAIVPDSITIVIMPLNKVGEEQLLKIGSLPATRPCLITSDTISEELLSKVQEGNYTHILVGPELAISPAFSRVCMTPEFQRRVALVAVDEAHLVQQWGSEFRPAYAQLSLLRSRLPTNTPWFACSATLDAATLKALKQSVGFNKDLQLIRTSVDRPEVCYIVEKIEPKKVRSFEALYFVLNDSVDDKGQPTPYQIPKTVVFIDSKYNIQKALLQLRTWLRNKSNSYSAQAVRTIISSYFHNMAEFDKKRVYDEFRKPDSKIRIILSTESLGLGVDISDIYRVVQYSLPLLHNLGHLQQRWGRSARTTGLLGEAVWLVDAWVFGDRESSTQLSQVMLADDTKVESSGDEVGDLTSQTVAGAKTKRKSAAERRAALPLPLWEFVNADRCRRKIILEFLEDHKADQDTYADLPPPERCCNFCSPKLRRYTPAPDMSSILRRPRKGSIEAIAMEGIIEWCAGRSNTLLSNAAFTVPGDVFLAEKVVIQLANACCEVQSMEKLTTIITPEWEWYEEYGEDLLQALKNISTQVAEQWKASSCKSGERTASQKERIAATPFKETPQQATINTLFQDISKMREKALTATVPYRPGPSGHSTPSA